MKLFKVTTADKAEKETKEKMKLYKVNVSDAETAEKDLQNMLKAIEPSVIAVIEEKIDYTNKQFRNFPFITIEKLKEDIEEYTGFQYLDDSKTASKKANTWLDKIINKKVPNDQIFEKLSKATLKKEYTYFEEPAGADFDEIRDKSELYDDNGDELFNSSGKIAKPKKYKYLGGGMAKNLETGDEFSAEY